MPNKTETPWISIKDKLPSESEELRVLIGRPICGTVLVTSAWRDGDRWQNYEFNDPDGVPLNEYPYWMPIPELPK